MRNSKKLTQEELTKRAKKLYFDVMPNLQFIFADEYGRFSYREQSLVEQNRFPEGSVYKIPRDGKAEGNVELDTLRIEYKALAGEDAKKNWGVPKLTAEIAELKK